MSVPASVFADVATIVVSVAALGAALYTHQLARRQGQVNNIPRLLVDLYMDARLRTPFMAEGDDEEIALNTAREARDWARGRCRTDQGWTTFVQRSRRDGTDESRVAFELSNNLQRLAANVFVGAVPLDAALATGRRQMNRFLAHA